MIRTPSSDSSADSDANPSSEQALVPVPSNIVGLTDSGSDHLGFRETSNAWTVIFTVKSGNEDLDANWKVLQAFQDVLRRHKLPIRQYEPRGQELSPGLLNFVFNRYLTLTGNTGAQRQEIELPAFEMSLEYFLYLLY